MSKAAMPSIARRLLWVTGLGSLLVVLLVTLAASLAVEGEVDELLDDALQASAEHLSPLLTENTAPASAPQHNGPVRFAWAWFDSAGRLVHASPGASASWQTQVTPLGFANTPDWRLYGHPLADQGLLVVAQTRAERHEARIEMSEFAVLAGLSAALLALPLLAWRANQELQPLRELAQRLSRFDATQADPRQLGIALGEANCLELEPVHQALRQISERLGERLDFERAFSGQAAHLLRTPLAGMDAQLAVALKENPGLPRLQRVREAAQRLQHMVVGLLRLFRTGAPLKAIPLDARTLLASLPLGDLQLLEGPPCPLKADAELLAAALLNLVDNAQRHGAKQLRLTQPAPQTVQLSDDGDGLPEAEREALLQRLMGPASADTGLGLRLALLVAQAHGGRLELPVSNPGFSVRLVLGD